MPHIMKNSIIRFCAVLLTAISIISCNSKSVHTPGVRVSNLVQRTTVEGVRDTILITDSVNIGDTLRLGMIVDAYFDYLKSVIAKSDEDKALVSLSWNEEQMDVIASDADLEHGKLVFVPMKVPACVTILQYIPLTAGTQSIHINVTSTAAEPYSYSSWYFNVAVREKKEP